MTERKKDNPLENPGVKALIQSQLRTKEILEQQPPMTHEKAVRNQEKLRKQSERISSEDER